MRLNELNIGDCAIVSGVKYNSTIKRRLLDIGLTPNTKIEAVLESFGKNIKAYMIRGALIAIRNSDAKDVMVDIIC